jgi:predicted ATPase/class 3 adenylate cyclase
MARPRALGNGLSGTDDLQMRDLPSGTVTLLFSDIEGSTRLLQELGEKYADVLADHRRVLRDVFVNHRGIEVDTQGDSFFVAFKAAKDALAAAAEAQAALAAGPVRVRMGLHTGEPEITDEGYVGLDVHRAARIMGAAHGGQVLISDATRGLLGGTDIPIRDLGEFRLKDLSAPQRLYQLGEADFLPPRALHRTNLPIQATPLVGRERELREAGALIRANRLLTLIGPGGSGKTRLSLQLGAEAADEFPDGVFWVPLQAITDPALVERAIGTSVGSDNGLATYISNKQLLVVLDNFEQLMPAAEVIASLLADTPRTKVLVTSREPLLLASEQRYRVEPLPPIDAVTLFMQRARAVNPDVQESEVIAEICLLLDRLPLAIELAAAQVSIFDPEEIRARLLRRLPLLASRARDAPARQRTLRATIEWSYALLGADEQQLFRRLAVFPGSWSLEAAEAICKADLHALDSLVVKSLVRRWATGRFGVLDTIHEYARELIDASPEAEAIRRRHAEFFLQVAESTHLNYGLPREGPEHFDVAIVEQNNFRAALAWTIESAEIELGLRVAVALEQLWVTADPREGMRWFAALLEHPGVDKASKATRAHGLRAFGSSAHIAGQPLHAEQVWNESLALWDELGDEPGRAVLLHRLGISAMVRGDLQRARALVDESYRIHRKTGDKWGQAQTAGTLGAIERDEGEAERAFELIERSATMAGDVGVPWWRGGMLAELACLQVGAGKIDEAERLALESLIIADQLRDRPGIIFGLGILARVAVDKKDYERAGLLWGSIEDENMSAPLGGWRRHREEFAARIGEVTDTSFAIARDKGRRMTPDEATAWALGTPATTA